VNNYLEECINTRENSVKNKLYIGISGKMGSGKSTLANNIIKVLDSFSIKIVSLAKPIKDLQKVIYNQLDMELEGVKDRDLLIALGLWGRGKDPEFWLDKAIESMDKMECDVIICDDVRFPNEAKWFNENGILLRLEGTQRGDNVDESQKNNVSEIAIDDFPFKHTISNINSEEESLLATMKVISEELEVLQQLKGA